MDVQVAVLADYANVAAGEKLNVMGIFDTIASTTFPFVHPFMVLALRIRLDYEDGEASHDLAIALRDEDGRDYFRASAKANVTKIEPGRFRGLVGAARAAELAGEVAKARQYYSALLELAAKSDGARPELAKAKQFLARKG